MAAWLRQMVATLAKLCPGQGRQPALDDELEVGPFQLDAGDVDVKGGAPGQPPSNRQNPANWLMMVAQAAPATPRSKTKISRGSSPMFSTAPLAMPMVP